MSFSRLGGSFRDPSGFVYRENGAILRQINDDYRPHYERLVQSGLYQKLVDRRWLIPHQEVEPNEGAYKTIQPKPIKYVSYPYEWCFSQLKDAALLTLDIQRLSLDHGMSLKDASAYNVQFDGSVPVFIDTLSFESYEEGSPWSAYGQFCRHFLGPLALMARSDVRLRNLFRAYIDGIPLDLCRRLLPLPARLRYGIFAHISMHARSQMNHQEDGRQGGAARTRKLSRTLLVALIESLRKTVERLRFPALKTEWGHYYEDTNYSADAMGKKERAAAALADELFDPNETIHDLGANTGRFSRVVAREGRLVVAHDIDDLAVERNYLALREESKANVLPLVLDLTNPSPATGWSLIERESTLDRIADNAVMALALIHHLAIGNNVPLPAVAEFFGRIAARLIIEFVPKEDSQVQRMLVTRKDIFPDYHQDGFEEAFERYFRIERRLAIEGSARCIYGMTRRSQ